jgi:hypothetical protein
MIWRANALHCRAFICHFITQRYPTMRGILLWVIGIPIPVIILLYLFHVL